MKFLNTIIFCLITSSNTIYLQSNPAIFPLNEKNNEEDIRNVLDSFKVDVTYALKSLKDVGNRSATQSFSLPIHGEFHQFSLTPNEVLDIEFKSVNPDYLTYDIAEINDPSVWGSLTISPAGLFAYIYKNNKVTSIYPKDFQNSDTHYIQQGDQHGHLSMLLQCGSQHIHNYPHDSESGSPKHSFLNIPGIGNRKFVYRLAIATTGEFYQANGNNDIAVRTVVINTVNALSAIYNNEMSIRFQVGSLIQLYTNPETDPFTPDQLPGAQTRPIQAATVIQSLFNQNQYDIGHVFHTHTDGDNWSGGGVASIRSVCNSFSASGIPVIKARGWSGSFNNVNNDWVNLVAHEFGHQFGANHTFNGTGESCTDNISAGNSFEIASGTTIMSYWGVCAAEQNIPSSGAADNYFHAKSIEEMYNYIYLGDGGTCGNPVDSENNLPVVNANPCMAIYNIPRNTPFFLKAEGSDADNDPLTFNWEQIDEDGPGTPTQGFIGSAAANSTIAPLFRSYPPSTTPVRYFPALDILMGGTSSPFEVLPNVARKLNFNVTVRDNNVSGGAQVQDAIEINVLNSGPLNVTRPVSGTVLVAGNNELITWSVNGSGALCNNIRVKLSVNGGISYPIILAENINYSSGSTSVLLPSNLPSVSNAKLMIECMDYSCFGFFAVSANTFTINSNCSAPNSFICSDTPVMADQGDPSLNLATMTKNSGNIITALSPTIFASSPTARLASWNENKTSCVSTPINFNYTTVTVIPEVTGTYLIRTNINNSSFISIHHNNFNPSNSCLSFIASNASFLGSSFNLATPFSVVLNACTEYVIVFSSFANLPAISALTEISGPGRVFEKNTVTANEYTTIYIAINTLTDIISFVSSTPDFRNLPGGQFHVYAASHLSSIDPSIFINSKVSDVQGLECILLSLNYRELNIRSVCKIESIQTGIKSDCNPLNNQFTQELIISYNISAGSGKLNVNGQEFEITGSPQSILLEGLISNGLPVDVTAFFTENTSCNFESIKLFTAPQNCCPFDVDLGNERTLCPDKTLQLDAGIAAQNYEWFRNNEPLGINERVLTVQSPGLYMVIVTNSTGCSKSGEVNIKSESSPLVFLPKEITICDGDNYLLEASLVPILPVTLSWYKDGVLIEGENQNLITVNQSGTYRFQATNILGCTSADSTKVTFSVTPEVDLGPDKDLCVGDMISLFTSTSGDSYQWFLNGNIINEANSSIFSPLVSGVYTLEITNDNFCKASDNVIVRFFESPFIEDFSNEINKCQGENFTLTAIASGYSTLHWYYENTPISGANNLALEIANSGKYTLEAMNPGGCTTSKSVTVNFEPIPVADLKNDVSACIGSEVILDAGVADVNYTWSLNGINIDHAEKDLVVSQSGIYSVTVTSNLGCTSSDEVNVSFVSGPSLDLGADKNICQGENYSIQAITNGNSIRWLKDGILISGENDFDLTVTNSGIYEAIVSGGMPACEVRKSVTITVNPTPNIFLGEDKVICEGDILVLDAGQDHLSYVWTLNGINIGTGSTVEATQSGTYHVAVINAFDCKGEAEVSVRISPLPVVVSEPEYDVCQGKSILISPESNGIYFEWILNDIVVFASESQAAIVDQPGLYKLIVSNADNCKTEVSILVNGRPSPEVFLGMDTILCPNEMILLNAGLHKSYKWSDGSTDNTLLQNAGTPVALTTSVISVEVENEFNCKASDSIRLTFLPIITASISSDKSGVCNGEPVMLSASGGKYYTWSGPPGTINNPNNPNITVNPEVSSKYTVVISDDCPQNEIIRSIDVNVFEPNNISAGIDTCVILGRSIRLGASGGILYDWDNVEFIEGPSNIPNPLVRPTSQTIFTVTITDRNGCVYEDAVEVCIIEDPLSRFKAVNIITPNGDGYNDELYFAGLEFFENNTLVIYNRWGNIVFEASGYQYRTDRLFDGTRNGERLPADTYYYILSIDGTVYKSSLTILWD